MKKYTLKEAEAKIKGLPYYKNIFEDDAVDEGIRTTFTIRRAMEHTELVSGITELKKYLREVDVLLRFYDINNKPKDKEYADSFIENVKEKTKYLKSKRAFLIDEIERISAQISIELWR